MTTTLDARQTPLLDISTKEIHLNWIDQSQPLQVPNNPLHYKAHKLQLLLERLDKQAANNAAQFNSKNYTEALNVLVSVYEKINSGAVIDDSQGSSTMATDGISGSAPQMGEGKPSGLGAAVSSDNPFAG